MELHDDESRARLPREAGAFEVCFASGLDLSELLEPTKNVVSTTAAAQLLQVKAQETLTKQQEEQQEEQLQQLAKIQAKELTKAMTQSSAEKLGKKNSKLTTTNSSSRDTHRNNPFDLMTRTNLMDTLVGMHHIDRNSSHDNKNNDAIKKTGNSNSLMGSFLSRRAMERKTTPTKKATNPTKAVKVAKKKTHRTKY